MSRFFFLLILILIIAWLVVGLQQEKEKVNEENLSKDESVIKIVFYDTWYDSLLQMPAYNNYVKVSKAGIRFLLPNDFTECSDLTDRSDAIYQFYSNNRSLYGVVNAIPLTKDSSESNFSKEIYCAKSLLIYRLSSNITMYDSSLVDVFPIFSGIKVHFLSENNTSTSDKDSLEWLVFFMENNKNLYILNLFARPKNFEENKSDIENIFNSVALVIE